ncbi:MAG: Uma2 family endonuclease [Armatimonas sp.]
MSLALKRVSPEDYLRLEKDANERSEYLDGEIIAMAGSSIEHSRLVTDTTIFLGTLLRSQECGVYSTDLRLRIERRAIFYPDISVVCGDESVDADDCLHNPIVLIEVLSSSTETYDRTKKWILYQQIPSLRAYVLLSQTQLLIEVFERADDNSDWIYRSITERSQSLPINCLGIALDAAEIYRRVDFSD